MPTKKALPSPDETHRNGSTPPEEVKPKALTPQDEIHLLIRARDPIICIVSSEEQRMLAILEQLADWPVKIEKDTRLRRQIYLWDCTDGLQLRPSATPDGREASTDGAAATPDAPKRARASYVPAPPLPGRIPDIEATKDPMIALEYLLYNDAQDAGLYVFNWLHHYMKDIAIMRMLAKLATVLRTTLKTLIIVSPILEVPPELQDYLTVYHYPLPQDAELGHLVERRTESLKLKFSDFTIPPEQKDRIVKALKGLPHTVADRTFSRWIVAHGQEVRHADTRSMIQDKAQQLLRKSNFLQIVQDTESLHTFGGYELLKTMLSDAALLLSDDAREFGLDYPKGFVLVGPPGVGKSYCAKVIAGHLGVMLVRMDLGAAYGPLLGQSESQFAEGLKLLEAVAPCVAWLEEYEKSHRKHSGSDGATPTEGRITAQWLTWMQECKKPIFKVATINRIDWVDPEQVREGRWDQVIFLDLPNATERAQILSVHLSKRKQRPERFDIPALAAESKNFTGAELEQVLRRALTTAFRQGRRPLETDDLLVAIRATTPQAVSRAEDIARIREWADKAQAVRASLPEPDTRPKVQAGIADVDLDL